VKSARIVAYFRFIAKMKKGYFVSTLYAMQHIAQDQKQTKNNLRDLWSMPYNVYAGLTQNEVHKPFLQFKKTNTVTEPYSAVYVVRINVYAFIPSENCPVWWHML
jgi:hypothetical protein